MKYGMEKMNLESGEEDFFLFNTAFVSRHLYLAKTPKGPK